MATLVRWTKHETDCVCLYLGVSLMHCLQNTPGQISEPNSFPNGWVPSKVFQTKKVKTYFLLSINCIALLNTQPKLLFFFLV